MAHTPARPTLKAIALACEVNKSTVSRILNNSIGFACSPELRERVLSEAERLGYRPHPLARALATRHSGIIAILGLWTHVLDQNSIYTQMARSAAEILQAGGYHVTATLPHPHAGIYPLWPQAVDAAVILQPEDLNALTQIEASGIPYLSLDGVAGPHGSAFVLDDRQGAELALKHLKELGHRRIAWRTRSIPSHHHSRLDRETAWREFLRRYRLAAPPDELAAHPDDETFLRECVLGWGATAVFCYSSMEAARLGRAARTLDLAIPGRLSIVCVNDDDEARNATIPFTAITTPFSELAKAGATQLLERLVRGAKPQRYVLRETLVVRASTAPPIR